MRQAGERESKRHPAVGAGNVAQGARFAHMMRDATGFGRGGIILNMIKRPWGGINGETAWLFQMEGDGICARVSNYGGVLQSLMLTDVLGKPLDVVLGYDALEDYRHSETFFGAMIGPLADRVAGGRCVLDGREVLLPLNAGPDSMHCGSKGFHGRLWHWKQQAQGLCLYRHFDEADLGFPGEMAVELRYLLPRRRTLRLEYTATCTRQTAASFTNHSYFNLNGGKTDCSGHVLTVPAECYAETARDVEPICTGREMPAEGTPLDLRTGVCVRDAVRKTGFHEIAIAGGIDHYFPVPGEGLRELARLHCPETGLTLRCRSDAPGLLIYTGNGLSGEAGKGGRRYDRHWGVCLETERFPNAVNLPERRAEVLLEPGEVYSSVTEFEFTQGIIAR